MAYSEESNLIYTKLKEILPTLKGSVSVNLAGINIKVKGKDGIGGLIEEWFGEWAKKNNYTIINPKETDSSQTFPDYYLGKEKTMLEIKAFDSTASANFDIANFESYHESISKNQDRLNADYLIFSYKLENGDLSIKNVWLKKIWEITCKSKEWPLKVQQKRKVIYNIRPATWYSSKTKFKPFESKEDFVKAVNETMQQYNSKRSKKKEAESK